MVLFLYLYMVIYCCLLTSTKVTAQEWEGKTVSATIQALGNHKNDQERLRKLYRSSPLQPIEAYANKGDKLNIYVKGDNVTLQIGTPVRDTIEQHILQYGDNKIFVLNKGLIYAINKGANEVKIEINGATGKGVFFYSNKASKTAKEQFLKSVNKASNVDVQLISRKAIVTISLESAKSYLKDPEKVLKELDKVLLYMEYQTGLVNDSTYGLAKKFICRDTLHLHKVDSHYLHFIELSYNLDIPVVNINNNEYIVLHGDESYNIMENFLTMDKDKKCAQFLEAVRINQMLIEGIDLPVIGDKKALDQDKQDKIKDHLSEPKEPGSFLLLNKELQDLMYEKLLDIFKDCELNAMIHEHYREHAVKEFRQPNGHRVIEIRYEKPLVTERMQFFMLVASTVTGWDLTPYFEAWGFPITHRTKEKLKTFLSFETPKSYDDFHLNLNVIKSVRTYKHERHIKIFLHMSLFYWMGKSMLTLKHNGKKVQVMKLPCERQIDIDDDCAWNYYHKEGKLLQKDMISLEVTPNKKGTKPYVIYNKTIEAGQILNYLIQLIKTEEPIEKETNQYTLNEIRDEIDHFVNLDNKNDAMNKLELVEQLYLETIVSHLKIGVDIMIVQFRDQRFKDYDIVIKGDNDLKMSEINKGESIMYIKHFNALAARLDKGNQKTYTVEINLHDKIYKIVQINHDTLKSVQNFVGTKGSHSLKNQKLLNVMFDALGNDTGKRAEKFIEEYGSEQKEIAKDLIGSISFYVGMVCVVFTDEVFELYNIIIWENGEYLAIIEKGRPVNGYLYDKTFCAQTNIENGVYTVGMTHDITGLYIATSRYSRIVNFNPTLRVKN